MTATSVSEQQRQGALIVGASSGIGAAVARRLARDGYALALVARRADALEKLAGEINSAAGTVIARAYPHDVSAYEEAPALFERIADDLGALRVVIYAAGVMPSAEGGKWTFAQMRETVETNVIGAMRWLDLAAERFTRQRSGVLVGISSVAGERGRRGNSVYQASKAALTTYLESLRYRLHASGVRVVTVKPGFVATPMTVDARMPKALVTSPEAVANRVARAVRGGSDVVFVPGYWAPILWVIRHLPSAVMARLNF